jgi:P27 family predicted phage terminase small subunit
LAGVKGRSGGHNRKPTWLKVLQGNPGRRPLHLEGEPQPRVALPRCPPQLGDAAKAEWKRIAPQLYKLGLLTLIDRAALTGYCAAYGTFIEAEAALRQAGLDEAIERVLRKISCSSLAMMHRYATEFGMTPASRTRVRAAALPTTGELPADEAFLRQRLYLIDQGEGA